MELSPAGRNKIVFNIIQTVIAEGLVAEARTLTAKATEYIDLKAHVLKTCIWKTIPIQ